MIGRILPITAVIVPFWLVRTMVGWAETFEVLPAILVVGTSFAATQWYWANHRDSNLVDIAAGLASLVVTIGFLKIWKPKRIWRFEDEPPVAVGAVSAASAAGRYPEPTRMRPAPAEGLVPDQIDEEWSRRDMEGRPSLSVATPKSYGAATIARAWMPFLILSIFVLLWGLPSVKKAINTATTPAFNRGGWDFPVLHKAVLRSAPVVPKPTPEAAKYDFNWLSATGSGCFLAALVAGALLGLGPRQLVQIFGKTLYKMRFAVVAICFMLGLGYVTRYSGLDAVLGLAFTRTGWFFPFFGTYLGWLGVALTGSDTSANALFGSLQRITAQQLNLNPILMCAANSAGGVMGKMVDAQSIVVATAATNQVGNEGTIFRFVVWHSVALAAIVGVIVMGYAYLVPHWIPQGLTMVK
ncbi:MAG: L-lactate permease, partial [Acidobacteriales bacterium]|nr:L-lactate permease [Terriglobales bacterium]